MRKYKTAAYIRLSKEDGDKEVSNSIINQRMLITDYVEGKEDIELVDFFEDDGFSGVSFDRPQFNRMIELIKRGTINCVIVKDLSRFGRNYIEMGRYLERTFPLLNVRFISINDNIDSNNKSDSDSLILPFKNLMNDAYARDISLKTRSGLDVKMKQGAYVGGLAPYGYMKDPSNKNKLLIDDEAAEVVRKVYNLKLQGYNNQKIADILNEEGILPPSSYRKIKRGNKILNDIKIWKVGTIRNILADEVYIGNLVQGKRRKVNLKVNKYYSELVKVEDTHEPIISKENFNLVKRTNLMDTRTSPKRKQIYPLSGFVICGFCGSTMTRHSKRSKNKLYEYFVCNSYKRNGECIPNLINVKDVEETITNSILIHLSTLDSENIRNQIRINIQNKQSSIKLKYDRLKTEREKNVKLKLNLYSDFKTNIINNDEYNLLKNNLTEKINKIDKELEETSNSLSLLENKRISILESILIDFRANKVINRPLMSTLIDKIIITKKHIEIVYSFTSIWGDIDG